MEITDHDYSEKSMADLMRQQTLTPEELATLLDMDINLIRKEAFAGHLKANIVDHDIISIERADALQWMNERNG